MKRLTVRDYGSKVQGIELRGDVRNPEPETVRVSFPGGDVDVVRCDDGSYWVHVRTNHPSDYVDDLENDPARIVAARLDIKDQHVTDANVGDFGHPDLYHLAVRVQRTETAIDEAAQTSMAFAAGGSQ